MYKFSRPEGQPFFIDNKRELVMVAVREVNYAHIRTLGQGFLYNTAAAYSLIVGMGRKYKDAVVFTERLYVFYYCLAKSNRGNAKAQTNRQRPAGYK